LYTGDNAGLTADALLRLERASADIDQLRKQNQDLKGLLLRNDRNKDISTNDGGGCPNVNNYPSTEHEYWRRKIETGISELYFYYASALKKPSENNEKLQRIVSHGEQQFASLQADAQRFANIDDVGHRRQAALANLTALMQRRLWHLQNPADCATARKLVCDLNKGCGFGCQLHHVAYCMMVAYGTGRTLILQNDGNTWRYSSTGWNAVFKPISDTCMAKTAPLVSHQDFLPFTLM
jgi:glycoprotein 6-alpha-L-fucosyltransferase